MRQTEKIFDVGESKRFMSGEMTVGEAGRIGGLATGPRKARSAQMRERWAKLTTEERARRLGLLRDARTKAAERRRTESAT